MLRESEFYCPECDDGLDVSQAQNRRRFLTGIGAGAAVALTSGGLSSALAVPPDQRRQATPAEGLIRELYQGMSAEQRRGLVYPWNHMRGRVPTRLGTYNSAILGKRLGREFTRPQQELVRRIVRSILSNDDAFTRLSRNNRWDGSGSFEGCGCAIFGEPGDNSRYAWVFSGHHLTLRCDGNSELGAAFGGPVYYGHSANGYSARNVYHYQTQQVQTVFDALSEQQRRQAIADRNPGDRERGIQFPAANAPKPGIAHADLTRDQKALLEGVMRTLLEPFRQQDADEVMQVIRQNGGVEQIHLAFYRDRQANDQQRWHFWRLEGPGFIWNYRVLPHVHCYVNITTRPGRG